MFICSKCQTPKERQLADITPQSYGLCEMCGQIAVCAEIPSWYDSGDSEEEQK